jgi:hypothetical protein
MEVARHGDKYLGGNGVRGRANFAPALIAIACEPRRRAFFRRFRAEDKTQIPLEPSALLFRAIAATIGPRDGFQARPTDGIPASNAGPVISLLEADKSPLDRLAQTAPGLSHMDFHRGLAFRKCLVHLVGPYTSRGRQDQPAAIRGKQLPLFGQQRPPVPIQIG